MREALAMVSAEGLPALWERHDKVHKALWKVRSSSRATAPKALFTVS
jgi:aspartate aminotransferase-like enzyme